MAVTQANLGMRLDEGGLPILNSIYDTLIYSWGRGAVKQYKHIELKRSKSLSPPIHNLSFILFPRGSCYKAGIFVLFLIIWYVIIRKKSFSPSFIRKCVKARIPLFNTLKMGKCHIHVTLQLFLDFFLLNMPDSSLSPVTFCPTPSYPPPPTLFFLLRYVSTHAFQAALLAGW